MNFFSVSLGVRQNSSTLRREAGATPETCNRHLSIALLDGSILIVGGHCLGRYLAECERYVP
jgi:hypothetical protein